MAEGDGSMEDALTADDVRASTPPTSPSTVLAGRYEILGLLGTGGMGRAASGSRGEAALAMAPPRRTASPRAVALRTLLLGAVASSCSEPARPAASAPATTSTTTSTPSTRASVASTPATPVSAPATSVSAIPPAVSAQAPTATSSAPPAPPGTSPTPLTGLPDGCRPARGLRRSTLKGERRDASGVPGCVDAVDGHCCGPAGGGMACARPFDRGTTLRLRSAGHAEVCCYALGGDEICEGRPLYVAGVLRRAALQSRADWSLAS